MKTKLEVILDQPIDLEAMIRNLDFSEENIIVANREQATLFLEASRYRVKKMRARIQAESRLEAEKSKAGMFLRGKKKANPKAGVTEGYIRDKVYVYPGVEEARAIYDKCLVYEEWAKLLLEAYRQRGHAIKNLGELLGAEAMAQARIAHKDLEMLGFENLKQAVRRKYPGRQGG